jgi:sugar phosphate isomerase/epimerase
VAIHSYSRRLAGAQRASFSEPRRFLEHCRLRGAGGIQVAIGARTATEAEDLRRAAESSGMFIEGQTRLPAAPADRERFEAELRSARAAGARVVRIALGDRRYEQFSALEQFSAFARRSWASLCLAEPAAARCGIDLAIENHKDFRAPELLDMLRRLGSERVGICVDVGNSLALLEDPVEVVEAFAPWARSVHLKDAGLAPCAEGFLLGDVPLAAGILDLGRMVRALRSARPAIDFTLEMITRDPLTIPCLTERYWATLPDVAARDLARTLALAREHAPAAALPRVSELPAARQLELEDENVRRCLAAGPRLIG